MKITADNPYDPDDPNKPSAPELRGGEAEQDIRVITIEVRSGCYGTDTNRCQKTTTITRTYERNVFAQYQLHYERHRVLPVAAAPATCFTEPKPDPPPADCDGVNPNALVVFADGDTFNGPVRYSGSGSIQYCLTVGGTKALEFNLIETKDVGQPQSLTDQQCAPTVARQPSWTKLEHKDDILRLPKWPSSFSETNDPSCTNANTRCTKTAFDDPVFYSTEDIYLSDVEFGTSATPEDGKSISIVSTKSIYVNGDIETYGTNEAGGPNVVALIAKGNIIMDHVHPVPVVFKNVAVLAIEGGIYATGFETACGSGSCPTFTMEGSIASRHLGLYGQVVGPTGWTKKFSYPPNFWRARPPWWPGFSPKEWRLVH